MPRNKGSQLKFPNTNMELVREKFKTWVTDNWEPNGDLITWRTKLAMAGWACPSWPQTWYGKGLPSNADRMVNDELYKAGSAGVASGVSMYLVAPTLLDWATDEQKQRFLLPILTGEHKWCQLFSEPEAGSDLAGLKTRAELDGDEWVINGQKVWNSGAHKADYGILLARTDQGAAKHHGISYFVIPMRQKGIEARPLRQMNQHASFNEVFLTDARVHKDNLIGDISEGWRVALSTLAHERSGVATRRPRFQDNAGHIVETARAEADEYFSTYRWYPQRAGRANLIVPELQRTNQHANPLLRFEASAVETLRQVAVWTTNRARDGRASGKPPGAEGSVAKLNMSVTAKACHRAHTKIIGAAGMLVGSDSPREGLIAEVLLSTPAQSIAGGTDEIQKNILAEKILGLPKEPV
ncbi:MAG: acyl-CoA dehydrogenase family protein [Actinomycetota bacterium]|nr:acyl-CoA dehydrogenase family protein [Actinomycetota bacterium]